MPPQIKQRLVGAAVLSSLAVLLIPLFLEPETPAVPVAVPRDMAPMPAYQFPDAPLPVAPDVMEEVEQGLVASPEEMAGLPAGGSALPFPASVPVGPVAAGASATGKEIGVPAAAAPLSSAAPSPGSAPGFAGWMIQLGSFANRQNADNLLGRLLAAGFQARVSPLARDGTTTFRVWVDGGEHRAAAEDMRKRLREELGYSGMILRE